MSEGHHNDEQVDKAFAAIPELLRQLKDAGVERPWVELHADASGRLMLGPAKNITGDQLTLASDLIKSRRFCNTDDCYIGITSCCGFVSFAEDQG